MQRSGRALFHATLAAALDPAPLAGLALGELELMPAWPALGWLLLLALTSQVFGWLLISVGAAAAAPAAIARSC